MDTLLFVDTETSGTDPAKDAVIELGVVLWHCDYGMLGCWSDLITHGSNEAEEVNRIDPRALTEPGVPAWSEALTTLRAWVARADVLVAHNAPFDSSFLPNDLGPWVCSMDDLRWPHSKPGDGLVKIALANDVGVVTAHRAIVDCMILARLFDRMKELGHDVRAMIAYGLRPKALYESLVGYERKEEVKSFGFKWNRDGTNRWMRSMARADVAGLPFPVRETTWGAREARSTACTQCRGIGRIYTADGVMECSCKTSSAMVTSGVTSAVVTP